MLVSLIVPLLAAVAPLAFAQQMVPTAATDTFPGCAVACAVLQQIQSQCIPPAVLASTQISYDNCFCQSPALTALYSSQDALCTAECTVEWDRHLLQTWFTNFCQQVGQGVDPVSAGAPAAPSTTLSTSTTSSTGTQQTGSSSGQSSDPEFLSTETGSTWFSHHWKWIVMLIVLAVGLTALAFLAKWWKRRHDRKMDQKMASMSGFPVTDDKQIDRARAATPELWGPHQHMHASNGYQYNNEGISSASASNSGPLPPPKTKGASRVEVSEVVTSPPAQPNQQR